MTNKLRSSLDFNMLYLLVVIVYYNNALCCKAGVQSKIVQFKSKLQELYSNNHDMLASIDCSRSLLLYRQRDDLKTIYKIDIALLSC